MDERVLDIVAEGVELDLAKMRTPGKWTLFDLADGLINPPHSMGFRLLRNGREAAHIYSGPDCLGDSDEVLRAVKNFGRMLQALKFARVELDNHCLCEEDKPCGPTYCDGWEAKRRVRAAIAAAEKEAPCSPSES